MPLRIAFDLDGVLADMDGELLRQATLLFGESAVAQAQAAPSAADPSPGEPPAVDASPADPTPLPTKLELSSRQVSRLWRHVATIDGFWESLNEIEPGVVARLAALANDRRWEVIFLTKRPDTAGATSQLQTQRWLHAKGFTWPSVFVVQGSRGRIAAALDLDFVIDDRPENCLDVVTDSKARAILVWRDDEKRSPAGTRRLGIGLVKSVDACLDILAELGGSSSERPGVVDRVMRLLGLKDEPAGV